MLCICAKVVFENFIPVVGKFIAAATLERAGHFQGCTTKGQLNNDFMKTLFLPKYQRNFFKP